MKAVIVEDSRLARQELKELLKAHKEIAVVSEAENVAQGIGQMRSFEPDLLFLDINLPDGNGFDLLDQLTVCPHVIFVTAYDQYALKAFKENAIDYLLKPIDSDDLVKVVKKITKNKVNMELGFSLKDLMQPFEKKSKKIAIPLTGKIVFINIDDVCYCKSDGNYTTIFMKNDEKHLYSKKIKDVFESFNSDEIIRVHQSYLVNVNCIKEYIKSDGYYLLLENKKTIPVSKPNRAYILEAMKNA